MSEEQATQETQTTETTGDEAIEAARKLLIESGHEVITADKIKGIKTKAAKEAAKEAAAARKALDEATARAKAAEDALKAKEREGLSEAQRLKLQHEESQKTLEKLRQKQAETEAKNAALQERVDSATISDGLKQILTHAVDLDMAEIVARAKLKLSAQDGQMAVEDNDGNMLIGDEAKEFIAQWWEPQKILRSPNAPGPTAGGSARPAAQKTGAFKYDPTASRSENLRRAAEYNREHGIK